MQQRIGRYEVMQELGRGSMGAVYKARDPQIGRTVAIKIILTANLSADDLQQYKQRFTREAQAAGQMSHAGIITIHDIAEDEGGQPFLVMEFIEGTGLDQLLKPEAPRLPLDRCLEIGVQVAEALDYAHKRGVVHRDIKPANILLTADGRAKIADFGIAKLAGVQMTQAGQMMGTPAFMSPEQFSGGEVDARSDLFSLGAMLYWMLTGMRPFEGDTLTVISFRVVYSMPVPVQQCNPDLPLEVDTVLARCLAKNPQDRYASCAELATDLRALHEGRPLATQPLPVTTPPMERTVAVPAMATVVATRPPQAEATKRDIPHAGAPLIAVEPAPSGIWATHKKKIIAAAVLLLLLIVAGVAFWPAAEGPPVVEEPVAVPPPTPRRTTPKTAPRPSQPAATQPSTEEPAKQPTPEELLREKAEELLREQFKKKPGKGKGRGNR